MLVNILEICRLKRKERTITTKSKNCNVISLRLSGSTVFKTEKDTVSVEAGELIYIPRGASYTQHTGGEEIICIHFEIIGDADRSIRKFSPRDPQPFRTLFLRAEALWRAKEKNYRYFCTALLYELIAATDLALPPKSDGALSPAMHYIRGHYCDPDFSMTTACGLCGISRVYFNRLFKEQYATTPIQYVSGLRIEKAKRLLNDGGYTHGEIAELCGFSDTKYFYTVFKKIVGITAGKYQKNTL